jgi:hypothetical protein
VAAESIWLGFDPREAQAFAVCRSSIRHYLTSPIPIKGVILHDLQKAGLYTRPIERRDGQLHDPISGAPMSTEFAISRFFTPLLAKSGWALFLDCDILCRGSLARLFELVHYNTSQAVFCVKHNHIPKGQSVKMDGQAQTLYARKNWSSVMLFNCDHPSNRALTKDFLNTVPGRDLHRFCWLKDDEIGELDPIWNYLVGYTETEKDPQLVHFTSGIPSMRGYETVEFADEYNERLRKWAA